MGNSVLDKGCTILILRGRYIPDGSGGLFGVSSHMRLLLGTQDADINDDDDRLKSPPSDRPEFATVIFSNRIRKQGISFIRISIHSEYVQCPKIRKNQLEEANMTDG